MKSLSSRPENGISLPVREGINRARRERHGGESEEALTGDKIRLFFMIQNLWQLLVACLLTTVSACFYSQAVAQKRYDTTSCPEDRKAIEVMCRKEAGSRFLNGDYIDVGAEGKTYFTFEEKMQEIKAGSRRSKSVIPVPGTHFLRIYNGDAAVRNATVVVVLQTPEGEFSLRVARIEIYTKQAGKWYFMAGQGTRVMPEDEKKEIILTGRHAKQCDDGIECLGGSY